MEMYTSACAEGFEGIRSEEERGVGVGKGFCVFVEL